MNVKQMFLEGKLDHLFNLSNYRTITTNNKFSAITKDWNKLERVVNTNPITKKCVNVWQAVGDYYDLQVKVDISKNKERNERTKKRLQRIIDKEFKPVLKKLIQIIAEKGNAYLMLNDEGILTAQHPDFFNLYWDASNQRPYYYKFKVDGIEQNQELQHGVEIWHFRNPFSQAQLLGSAPVESVLDETEAYTKMFAYISDEFGKGLTGNVLASIKKGNDGNHGQEMMTKEEDGTYKWAKFSQTVSDLFGRLRGKTKNGSGVIALPFVDTFYKFGGNMNEMQANEMLEKMVEFIANAYNLTAQDLGFGRTTNTNTVEFAEQQEEKIGKPLKSIIEDSINQWYLPVIKSISTNYTSNTNVWVEFEAPNNEDEQAKRKQYLELFKYDILTDIEKRQILVDHFGLEITPEDFEKETLPEPAGQTVDVEPIEEEKPEQFSKKDKKKITYQELKAKYPFQFGIIDDAIESFYFVRTEDDGKGNKIKKGFLAHLENAIDKQIKRTAENLLKQDKLDIKKAFVKLETVLPFNVLNGDLNNFANFAQEKVNQDIKKSKIGFSLSAPVKAYFEARTILLLKGYDELSKSQQDLIKDEWADTAYEGVDGETLSQITTFIKNNAEKSIDELVVLLLDKFKDFGEKRAVEIAETEVANAVDKVRFDSYFDAGYKFKRHLTVRDGRVVPISRQAEAEGIVPIDFVYNHQIGNGLRSPLHFRERGSEIYGVEREDLEL